MNEARPYPEVGHVASALIRPEVILGTGVAAPFSVSSGVPCQEPPTSGGDPRLCWRSREPTLRLRTTVLDCLFWREVGQEAFGGWHVDLDHVEWLSRRVVRERFGIIAMPLLKRRQSWPGELRRLSRVHRPSTGHAAVSGARRIVDSSIVLSQYGALAALANMDLRSRPVRDSRAWPTRGRANPEARDHVQA
jgi:hypothetical protein